MVTHFPQLSTRGVYRESYGKPVTTRHPSTGFRVTLRNPDREVILDHDGHEWTITGRWCVVCGWPLHRLHPADDHVHPTCRGGGSGDVSR